VRPMCFADALPPTRRAKASRFGTRPTALVFRRPARPPASVEFADSSRDASPRRLTAVGPKHMSAQRSAASATVEYVAPKRRFVVAAALSAPPRGTRRVVHHFASSAYPPPPPPPPPPPYKKKTKKNHARGEWDPHQRHFENFPGSVGHRSHNLDSMRSHVRGTGFFRRLPVTQPPLRLGWPRAASGFR